MRIMYELVKENDDDGIEVGKIKPCPFCEKIDKLTITGKRFYNELVKEHGDAVISINCKRCDVSLSEYFHGNSNTDYNFRVGFIVAKWNNRRNDNGD